MENNDMNDVSGLLVPDVNEESVDIYDGLEINPSSNAEKSSPNASQLKESMDLYEEIVTEEQQSRESTYSDLKSRFQAAQCQIKELHRRLEQMELQNTGLTNENFRLKKNISALLQTARLEVTRKDAEIQRLNQQCQKGRYHHQAHINNLRDQNLSSRSSTGSSKRQLPPSLASRPPAPPPPPSSLPPPLPPLPASPLRENLHLREPSQPRKEINSSTYPPSESCPEEKASKASTYSHSKRSSRGDSSTRHSESDKHKYKHREEKGQSQKQSESSDRRHRTASDTSKDCYAFEKNRSHKSDKSAARRYDSGSHKSRNYLHVEGHHRSERSKSPPLEILHSTASSDEKKGRSRESRQDKVKMSTSDSEYGAAHSSKECCSRDNRKIKTSDRRSSDWKGKSSSKQHAEYYSDSSKERKGDRLSKDYERKEERRCEDETSRKHKRSTLSETSREHEKQSSKEADQGKEDVCRKERKEKTQETIKRSCREANITEKTSVEENSPNRKLCFMETLNLTLSPVKKPACPNVSSQDDLASVGKAVENEPGADQCSQPNIEDMCVIDEVHSCDLEAGPENVAEQCPNSPKTPISEKIQRCEDLKDVQGKDENPSEMPAADKHLKDYQVQTTSAHIQPLDTTENKIKGNFTHKSPESTSLKAINAGISNISEDKINQASNNQVDEFRPLEATNSITGSLNEKHRRISVEQLNTENNTDQCITVTESVLLDSCEELKCRSARTAVQKNFPVDSVQEGSAPSLSQEIPVTEDFTDKASLQNQQISLTTLPQDGQQGLCPPATSSSQEKDAVSSTISLESLPQEGLSLPDAIYILTQTSEKVSNSCTITSEQSSSAGCIAVSKVSSTTEETALPEKFSDLTVTPKKNFSPAKGLENNFEPSSSVPLLHDEDSMMRTLSNLKRIPDAISPLRSPIRISKRSHLHVHGKPGHIKSLEKDFYSTAVDDNTKTLDINKENKYPGSSAKHDTQNLVDKVSDLPSSLSDTEVEEGEILSESDETAVDSPVPASKRAKLTRPVRSKPSPRTVSNRPERGVTPEETNETAGILTRSPKSRFKTVCPAATKSSFSTIEEVMETFKLVRAEIRKKYMKLHKTFPKKSFYGVMDNFRESFLEFVGGAHFSQISSQQEELKSNLKKLIVSVFSKVSNNGIVKRIFEQQAVDLKQKLWDFVDVQVEYLFRDIYTTMKGLCKPARAPSEDNTASRKAQVPRQLPDTKPQIQLKKAQSSPTKLSRIKPCTVPPYKTGLGSRGKDIRIAHIEKDRNVDQHPTNCPNTQAVVSFRPAKNVLSTPDKNNTSSLVVSQNGSLLDKTEFELLTEQQASSLTFNLVRDTQMGEIFKCLLQGSDLLETSGITGDSTTWSLATPKKDGERFISITTPSKFDSPSKLLSPSKFDTPSKLIATWSSISPRKMSSPRPKDQIPLNPALFDESCLLELPLENRAIASQKTYSILAEDLAVSLTIPSPLKSDSHLSFLQPSSLRAMSTPDSVISAHISEDALLDGDDATEQDIHLALDTDNSSCGSGSSVVSETLVTPFMFKPDLPMQALVMEKSNDHFIVKIRQASTGADSTLTAEDSLSQTLTEEDGQHREEGQERQVFSDKSENGAPSNAPPLDANLSNLSKSSGNSQTDTTDINLTQGEGLTLKKDQPHTKDDKSIQQITSKVCLSKESLKNLHETADNGVHSNVQSSDKFIGMISQPASRENITVPSDESASQTHHKEDTTTQQNPLHPLLSESDSSHHHPAESSGTNQRSQVSVSSDSERCEMEVSDSERGFANAKEGVSSTPDNEKRDCLKGGKRKKHQEQSKAKRPRKKEEHIKEEVPSNYKNNDRESKSSPTSPSSSSLYAKNVIKKKGEVVLSWTRDEDRAILIELKTKGASRETFSALSEKLNKPSGQIAHRFYQLMKLYKKQEKMDT